MRKVRLAYAVMLLITATAAVMAPTESELGQTELPKMEIRKAIEKAEVIPVFNQAMSTPLPAKPTAEVIHTERIKAEVISEHISEPTPTPSKYSDEEKELIARVVYAESRGEPFEGQIAVAAVILNRYESGKFGKSVRSVVYAKEQFAVSSKYSDENMAAVEAAIAGTDYPDTMYYFQKSKRKKWGDKIYYARIGNHSFYLGK
ncbi:MAG: cell wall hydrolase [Burkholderiales bacterium]